MPDKAIKRSGVIERLSNAYRALTKAKPITPDLGQQSLVPYASYYDWSRFWRTSAATDYRHEVGQLDLNSLAMAVVNFTATRIPEAKPVVSTTTPEGDQKLSLPPRWLRLPLPSHLWAR